MTVEFHDTHDPASPTAATRAPWSLLASSACWLVAAALLVLATTLDVWRFDTSWPTGNGLNSGRVSIVYDAWGDAAVTNLSDFGAPPPQSSVSWAPLLVALAVVFLLGAGGLLLVARRARATRVVVAVGLVATGVLIGVVAAATSAQTTFRRPFDYADISPDQAMSSANGSMVTALIAAVVIAVAGTVVAAVSARRG